MNAFESIFFNPKSIFYWPFLASGILITVLWLMIAHRRNLKDAALMLFDPKIWLSKQTLVDAICSLVMLFGILKLVGPTEEMFFGTILKFENILGVATTWHSTLQINPLLNNVLATVIVMLAYDLASYGMHRLMHKNSFLWRIHKFHHSAEKLTFFTTYRQNPLEPLLLAAARAVASALGLVIYHFFVSSGGHVISVLGLGAGFFLYMFTVNLHHSPVPVSYPRVLRRFLISPHVHHLHHSHEARHDGKNYGVIFSFWDRWFNSYCDERMDIIKQSN